MLNRVAYGSVVIGLALSAHVAAQEEKAKDPPKDSGELTPDEQVQQLQQQYSKTQQEYTRIMAQMRTYPAKFWAIAEKNPKTTAARNALSWILRYGTTDQALMQKASKRFLDDHLSDKDVLTALGSISRFAGGDAEGLYRRVLKENPHPEVKAGATYLLANSLVGNDLRSGSITPQREAELIEKLKDLREQAGDGEYYGRPVTKLLDGMLFEIQHLQIGKTAPEVSGEDIDGAPFKLTEYRGKVVVIDFWGDW
jgi:hypothetical protein